MTTSRTQLSRESAPHLANTQQMGTLIATGTSQSRASHVGYVEDDNVPHEDGLRHVAAQLAVLAAPRPPPTLRTDSLSYTYTPQQQQQQQQFWPCSRPDTALSSAAEVDDPLDPAEFEIDSEWVDYTDGAMSPVRSLHGRDAVTSLSYATAIPVGGGSDAPALCTLPVVVSNPTLSLSSSPTLPSSSSHDGLATRGVFRDSSRQHDAGALSKTMRKLFKRRAAPIVTINTDTHSGAVSSAGTVDESTVADASVSELTSAIAGDMDLAAPAAEDGTKFVRPMRRRAAGVGSHPISPALYPISDASPVSPETPQQLCPGVYVGEQTPKAQVNPHLMSLSSFQLSTICAAVILELESRRNEHRLDSSLVMEDGLTATMTLARHVILDNTSDSNANLPSPTLAFTGLDSTNKRKAFIQMETSQLPLGTTRVNGRNNNDFQDPRETPYSSSLTQMRTMVAGFDDTQLNQLALDVEGEVSSRYPDLEFMNPNILQSKTRISDDNLSGTAHSKSEGNSSELITSRRTQQKSAINDASDIYQKNHHMETNVSLDISAPFLVSSSVLPLRSDISPTTTEVHSNPNTSRLFDSQPTTSVLSTVGRSTATTGTVNETGHPMQTTVNSSKIIGRNNGLVTTKSLASSPTKDLSKSSEIANGDDLLLRPKSVDIEPVPGFSKSLFSMHAQKSQFNNVPVRPHAGNSVTGIKDHSSNNSKYVAYRKIPMTSNDLGSGTVPLHLSINVGTTAASTGPKNEFIDDYLDTTDIIMDGSTSMEEEHVSPNTPRFPKKEVSIRQSSSVDSDLVSHGIQYPVDHIYSPAASVFNGDVASLHVDNDEISFPNTVFVRPRRLRRVSGNVKDYRLDNVNILQNFNPAEVSGLNITGMHQVASAHSDAIDTRYTTSSKLTPLLWVSNSTGKESGMPLSPAS